MGLKLIHDLLNEKLEQNDEIVVLKFYELRVKLDLNEEETNEFLRLASIRLTNLGYDIFFTGDSYVFKDRPLIVQDNELLVAIKKT